MATEIQRIAEKLDNIKSELDYIKTHMIEKDELMTSDEFNAYKKSFDKKSLVSLEETKKQLGL